MEKLRVRFSHKQKILITSVIAIIVATSILSAVPGSAFGIEEHYECFPQRSVAMESFLTPLLIVNSPYEGRANGISYEPSFWLPAGQSASVSTATYNGSVVGIFSTLNWTLWTTSTELVIGPGIDSVCAGKYVATLNQPERGFDSISGSLGNNSTVTAVAETVQFAQGSSVIIQDNYSEDNAGSLGNCDTCNTSMLSYSPNIPVVIPFTVAGQVIYAKGVVPWSQRYTYTFNHGGLWLFDNLTKSGTGSGIAFYYEMCSYC